ncbi:MAG: OmpA family protein [Epsilonproteobacteria bacterium]|nr:OmpA family protein [Campylobacterota bacterium]
MKNLLTLFGICGLLVSTIDARNGYDEIGYMTLKYGLTSIDDNIDFDKHTFALDFIGEMGHEIKPKLDLAYVKVDADSGVDYLLQGSLNAYKKSNIGYSNIYPYIYGGLGYEYVEDGYEAFDSSFYLQGALGVEIPISQPADDLHLITELKYMQMIGSGNNQDNEVALFLGLKLPIGDTFSYYDSSGSIGGPVESYAELEDDTPVIPESPKAIVIPESTMNTNRVFADSDGDGVRDSLDICPKTPIHMAVNNNGCPIKDEKLHIEPVKSVVKPSQKKVTTFQALPTTRKILNVHFQLNSDQVTESSRETIRSFVEAVNNRRFSKILVEGYSDSTGVYARNMSLSKRRAESVKSLMVQYGIDNARIRAVGKGPVNPVASNDTEEGRAKNRRIEIVVE